METIQNTVKNLPHAPGVYIYRNGTGEVIYVGKAVDLAKRVKQYFIREDAVGAKTPILVAQIAHIETVQTATEFDAILLEAQLIRKYYPKYNIVAKDDKSPLYVYINTNDELPTVQFVRKPKKQSDEKGDFFGPFQSAKMARSLLRSLRYSIPYCTQKIRNGKPCFYTHIGLCYPCASVLAKMPENNTRTELVKQYRKHIFRLRDVLSGKSTTVIHELETEMTHLADKHLFEEAAQIRNQIQALHTVLARKYDPNIYLQGEQGVTQVYETQLMALQQSLLPYYPDIPVPNRIECYDISNIIGKQATGSMVVLTNGRPDTNEYRRFRIKSLTTSNDFAMMSEMITRRFNHDDWPKPHLIVIDGGKGQVRAAITALTALNLNLPLIGLAKREEEIIIPTENPYKTLRLSYTHEGLHALQRIRDEAHRFAITYHRLLRSKIFIQQKS